MADFISILALGFFLGMRHATDADHVIAVSTIVTRQRSAMRSAVIGALWGLGHTLTIFVIGSAIILLGLVIPARVGLTMEFSVALMLMALGAWNLSSFFESANSAGVAVAGTHTHGPGQLHVANAQTSVGKSFQASTPRHSHRCGELLRPVIVGIVHGMAGSAAIALLVLATIHSARWAVAYLVIFGVGTITGMVLMTTALGSAIHFGHRRALRFDRSLRLASGLISLAFGVIVAYQIGYVGGLFTDHPTWFPR